MDDIEIVVTKADGMKCPRCWKVTGAGRFNFDGLCDPCAHLLIERFPDHESVPHIQQAYADQRARWVVKG